MDRKFKIFEGTGLVLRNNEVFANRVQLQKLYGVPKTTLADNINSLKEDGLIVGTEVRPNSGKPYEVYNLDEIISVGFRLKSEVAIRFQRWAREIIKDELVQASEKIKIQQAQLDYFWGKEDIKDLYS